MSLRVARVPSRLPGVNECSAMPRFRCQAASASLVLAFLLLACAPLRAEVGVGGPEPYPHAAEPIGSVRQSYDGALSPELAITTFRNFDRLFPARRVPRSTTVRSLPAASEPLDGFPIPIGGATWTLPQFLERNRVSGLLVLQAGRVKLELYRYGNTPQTRWMSMSVAKSLTATLTGAAIRDGHIRRLDDRVTGYLPELAGTDWEGVTLRQVLTMSSGLGWSETYTDPASDRRRLLEAQIAQRPGALLAVMAGLHRVAPPGAINNYSTGETQVAGEVLRAAVGMPLADYLAARVWGPAGMEADATWCLDSPDGHEIGGSAFNATLRDYGRLGLFLLDEARPGGARVLPEGWVREAGSPQRLADGALIDYGLLWWPGTSVAARADGAFMAQGIHGQYLYLNPALDAVVVMWSARPEPSGGDYLDDEAFLDAVAAALRR